MKKSEWWRSALKGAGPGLRRLLLNNLGLKLLSLACALFLWSYMVITSPSITREKVVSDVNITISGQPTLESRGMAVLSNLGDMEPVQVVVKAPQSSYAQVSNENVRVEADLSSVRQAGLQSLRLRGVTAYGTVAQVIPQYIEVEVEKRDQRYVPVNVELVGDMDESAYWYNVSSRNPSQVVVSGPASRVTTVSEALVQLDVGDRTGSHSREVQFTLLDDQGSPVEGQLGLSTSSVRVSVDVYPKKILGLQTQEDQVLRGHTAQGFQVTGVEISPETVIVAAEQNLLDSLESLPLEPISLNGASQSFDTVTRVRSLSGIQHLSTQQVAVRINIQEQNLSRAFGSVAVEQQGLQPGLVADFSTRRVNVKAEGLYTQASTIAREDIQAVVNLDGLLPGQYVLPVEVTASGYPELLLAVTPATVAVTINQAGGDSGAQ